MIHCAILLEAHTSFPNDIEMASPIDLTASDDDGEGLCMLEHNMQVLHGRSFSGT